MLMQTLLVNKTNFGDVAIVEYDEGPLAKGHIRVDIDRFALTANNVTRPYARLGVWTRPRVTFSGH